ncbi:MAG: PhzF family phenazine biosynthesis protein [Hyphomicrobiales bacterium]|nr:PhzF family phenazine biosynthesis protein [Hyphomicrobiales bacterium]
MNYPFYTLDVFTGQRFAGNPLAVVLEADQLSGEEMQEIAREFNLSETVFVMEPRDPVHTARLRIFAPDRELAFAGHPTIGTAALLAHLRAADMIRGRELALVLEEGVGPVPCAVWRDKAGTLRASFEIIEEPHQIEAVLDPAKIAAALGIKPADIGFGGHEPGLWSAGNPLIFVPLRHADLLGRLQPVQALWQEAFAPGKGLAFIYAGDHTPSGQGYRARMLFTTPELREDPATGSAAAAFAGVMMRFERWSDGAHLVRITQGEHMGRRSEIILGLEIDAGELTGASVSGAAVIVTSGQLTL